MLNMLGWVGLVWFENLAPPFRILPPLFRILNGGGRINARAFKNQHRFVYCVMSSTVA